PVEVCLKQKTSCFVVVGAAHLVGPDSLVAMLRKKGYTVEQQ
ncbi:MAG: TraB/GumN family protein, partial [Acidobacteria bacterium]|nr:TraB/GumN family protein [Acidobacteriota bacterium]